MTPPLSQRSWIPQVVRFLSGDLTFADTLVL